MRGSHGQHLPSTETMPGGRCAAQLSLCRTRCVDPPAPHSARHLPRPIGDKTDSWIISHFVCRRRPNHAYLLHRGSAVDRIADRLEERQGGLAVEFDLKIAGGTIIDGTGRPGYRGDVGIRAGRIAALGDLSGVARETLDATGKVVSPGFV